MGKIAAKKVFNPLSENKKTGKEIPSLYDETIVPGSRKRVLLIKVPYCIHPGSDMFQESFSEEDLKVQEQIQEDETSSSLNSQHTEEQKEEQKKLQDVKTKTPFRPIPSLALATLSSFFEKYNTHDYKLKCIDVNLAAYDDSEESGSENENEIKHIDTQQYIKILENIISKESYDILAISAMFVMSQKWVDDAVKFSRKHKPDAKIMIGGGYPTIYPEYVLKKHDIDASIVGEGDDTFLHMVNRFNNIVDEEFNKQFDFEGYAAKDKNKEIFYAPRKKGFIDLKKLPAANYEWLDLENYFKKSGQKTLPLEASRGCPYGCTYCNTFISWGKSVRYKDVDSLIDEVAALQNTHNPEIHFVDDNLSFDRKWTMEFLDKLIKRNLKLNVSCANFHYKRLDEEILEKLFAVGVNEVKFALESGADSTNKRIHRVLDLKKAKRLIDFCRSKNKSSVTFWMVGFPGESIEELRETFTAARDTGSTKVIFSMVMPYPGTKLYEEATSESALSVDTKSSSVKNIDEMIDLFLYRSSKSIVKSKQWSTETINNLMYDANIDLNFINSPGLKTDYERDFLMMETLRVLKSIPEHAIANILVGYLFELKNDAIHSKYYYDQAKSIFKVQEHKDTFLKYLHWDSPVIKNFLNYIENEDFAFTTKLLNEKNVKDKNKTNINHYYY
jgi:anaerobic magnesium-protoporphyrin IX monomethyl ester cyclase